LHRQKLTCKKCDGFRTFGKISYWGISRSHRKVRFVFMRKTKFGYQTAVEYYRMVITRKKLVR
jgi:hypothetical protein